MKVIKLFLLLVFFVVAGAGIIFVAQNNPKGKAVLAKLHLDKVEVQLPTAPRSIPFLADKKLPSVDFSFAGKVLGAKSENTEQKSEPPLHQRAFEYARYEYCQQVVKDYEKRYSEASPNPVASESAKN